MDLRHLLGPTFTAITTTNWITCSAYSTDASTFNVLQLNANGIGNKLTELGVVLERYKVKVAVIQESKLSPKSKNPCIQNYTTVREDRSHGQGGGLLIFIHGSMALSRQPLSPGSLSDPHLGERSMEAELGNTKLIISNVYIPPASSCSNGYHSSIEHLLTTPDTLILGDFNAYHPSWYSRSTDTRGRKMADSINGSDYGILNWDSPTRVPPNAEPSSPDVSLASASLITSCSWQTLSTLSSDHLPILIRLQMKSPSNLGLRRTYVNLKKANWDRYRQEVEAALTASVLFQQTANEMRRSSVQFYSKQHHTTSLLDATDSMRNLYQQRYWT